MRGPSFKVICFSTIIFSWRFQIEILLVALGTWPVRDPRFVDTFVLVFSSKSAPKKVHQCFQKCGKVSTLWCTFWCTFGSTFCSQNVELVDSFVHFCSQNVELVDSFVHFLAKKVHKSVD